MVLLVDRSPGLLRALGLTLSSGAAYRWAVEPVSTGAACPRNTSPAPAMVIPRGGRGRAVPAEPGVDTTAVRPGSRSKSRPTPDTGEQPREQAYVPAEQPPPSQDARFPSADAYPRRPRHLGVASSQGSQPPGRLSATSCVDRQVARRGRPVLTRANRLTSSRLFSQSVRRGHRAGARTLVLHLDPAAGVEEPQVGLVVSKAVGPAVTRNLVKRRLRHLARERVSLLPGSAVLVVRALPAAADAPYGSLEQDFDQALDRILGRLGRQEVTT
jgi:ribonuclease P protein component